MWFIPGILALPLIEIALFVVIGARIGLWATLAWVVATAVIGGLLIRTQGARAMTDLRRAQADLRDPTTPLANGAMTVLAGMLLMLPGFFTDACGLLLLLPPVRALLRRAIGRRVAVQGFGFGAPRPGPGNRAGDGPGVIDGEFHEIEPGGLPPRGVSGWTRHKD
ncbi:MAG TPA: FxsA family protein [Paenirhodobacter sp.]